MTYRIKFEAYSSNFSLPSAILGDGFFSLDGDFLKVILLIFKNADKNYSVNLLSNLLGLSEARVEEAIRYWIDRGVLCEKENETIAPEVIAISRRNVKTHSPATGEAALPPAVAAISGELAFLLECMENLLHRPVTTVEYKSVIHILEYIKLPADVVLMAIEYCVSIDKMNARYLEKVCANWADNGIVSHDLAEQYLRHIKKSRSNEEQVKRLFGIENRNLIESEKACVSRWFNEFGFDLDAIRLAYEKTIAAIGKLSFPYINKILLSWHEKGYRTVEDVRQSENGSGGRKPCAASRSVSYDIDELDEYWKKNVPKF